MNLVFIKHDYCVMLNLNLLTIFFFDETGQSGRVWGTPAPIGSGLGRTFLTRPGHGSGLGQPFKIGLRVWSGLDPPRPAPLPPLAGIVHIFLFEEFRGIGAN